MAKYKVGDKVTVKFEDTGFQIEEVVIEKMEIRGEKLFGLSDGPDFDFLYINDRAVGLGDGEIEDYRNDDSK